MITRNPRTAYQRFVALGASWAPTLTNEPVRVDEEAALALLRAMPPASVSITQLAPLVQGVLWSGSTLLVDAMRAWIVAHPLALTTSKLLFKNTTLYQRTLPLGAIGVGLCDASTITPVWTGEPYAPAADLWILATQPAHATHPVHRLRLVFNHAPATDGTVLAAGLAGFCGFVRAMLRLDGLTDPQWDSDARKGVMRIAMDARFVETLPWDLVTTDELDALIARHLTGNHLDAAIIQSGAGGSVCAAAALSFVIQYGEPHGVLDHLRRCGSHAFGIDRSHAHAVLGFVRTLPDRPTLVAIVAQHGQNAATQHVLAAINARHTFAGTP